MERANAIATAKGMTPYNVMQQRYTYLYPKFNAAPKYVFNEAVNRERLRYLSDADMPLVAYSCLAKGGYESDERIPAVVYCMMKNYYELLSAERIKLFAWGAYRWFEGFIALNFLAERHPDEEWIASLARLLETQGIDYRTVRESWKVPLSKWTLYTHVVNLAMMYKSEAVSHKLLGKSYEDLAEDLYTTLISYNGTVTGTMTGDECLSGTSPIQGTELCSVVEMMYSFELL